MYQKNLKKKKKCFPFRALTNGGGWSIPKFSKRERVRTIYIAIIESAMKWRELVRDKKSTHNLFAKILFDLLAHY